MSDLLWQKSGIETDPRIMRFLAGADVLLDRELFLFDIEASKAHVEGLDNIGILSADETDRLVRELEALAGDFRDGDFVLDDRFE
ncbi:MAG: argininosuccinate lyase, partial [Xanthomonadales bacterium]|nr:argininosuccinate lyase [Xanthomonadales bacterium]